MYIKPIDSIDNESIKKEWDDVAYFRNKLIVQGKDISLLDVTEPFILENIDCTDKLRALDCGCGTGHLTYMLSKLCDHVIGIDFSGKSIEIACDNYPNIHNLLFAKYEISDFARINEQQFNICTANMVLMDTPNLDKVINSVYKMLESGGTFIFTITHPCFWPIYWNYFYEPWFNYNNEIIINAPFCIYNKAVLGSTTHIHRSLNQYIDTCEKNGFKICKIQELYPKHSHMEPDYDYSYPRFIGFVCQKKNNDF